jgi:FixJ family two-component response regulator
VTDQILFVDDDSSVLDGYQRLLQRQFRMFTALGGQEGLATIERIGPFAVVISDMRMPGMTGAEFLGQVRLRAPDSVRMLLTGYADVNAAIEAVNKGNIFRYLTKPCGRDSLVEAIQLGIAQYHATVANQALVRRLHENSNLDSSFLEDTESSEGLPGPSRAMECLARVRNEVDLHVVLLRFSGICESEPGCRNKDRAVAARFLQQNLSANDQIYGWQQHSLLALLRRPHSHENVRAEVESLISGARDYVAKILGRPITPECSIDFEVLTSSEVHDLLADRTSAHQ